MQSKNEMVRVQNRNAATEKSENSAELKERKKTHR